MELIEQLVRDVVQRVLPTEIASLLTANEWMIWAAVALIALVIVGAAVSALQGGD
jgi:hypothetical protein